MTRGLLATMLERADTKEAIGLNRSRLRSTRPIGYDMKKEGESFNAANTYE
jgi:hypothetical protein